MMNGNGSSALSSKDSHVSIAMTIVKRGRRAIVLGSSGLTRYTWHISFGPFQQLRNY